jgi:DNA-binding FadR family transcriptional regulator
MHSLGRIAPRGTYVQVVEQLEGRILRGEFAENEFLPPEAELAAQLGVGRRALRDALRSLEIKGLVEIRHGVGTRVCRNDLNSFLTALQQNVRTYLHLNRADADQVRELRALFESAAIERLGSQPDAARLAALAENLHLQRQAAEAGDAETYERHHLAFHRQIVGALANPLIDMLYGQVLELMFSAMKATADRPGVMRQVIEEHQTLLDALQAGSVALAQRLLKEHLQGFSRGMAGVVEKAGQGRRKNDG